MSFNWQAIKQAETPVNFLVMIFSYFTDIGGIVINITIVITSETCIDGKYNQSFLLEKFKEVLIYI